MCSGRYQEHVRQVAVADYRRATVEVLRVARLG